MNWRLNIRYAIVTGGARGIGSATIKLLCSQGYQVGLFDRIAADLVAEDLDFFREQIILQNIDVCNSEEWADAIEKFSDISGGQLNLLVNNAGIITRGRFDQLSTDSKRKMVEVNLMGPIYGIEACLPMLKVTPAAKIINVSSIAACSGWPQASVYSASKSALSSLTESLAIELSTYDIGVADVQPGFVRTELFGNEHESVAIQESLSALWLAWLEPEQVAEAIVSAIDNPKIHHTIGWQARVYSRIAKTSDLLTRRISRRMDKLVSKEFENREI